MSDGATSNSQDIAIIGMAGRFPQASNLDTFWENLCNGIEALSQFSDEELIAAGVEAELLADPRYVKAGVVLEDIDRFDAPFFGYSPREAEILDPQHRLFLETAWQALEDAGYAAERFAGIIGLYGGTSVCAYLFNLYANAQVIRSIGSFHILIANDKDYLATRTAYKLNLNGPAISVQTACSTSLVAVHLACQSLLTGECDITLAGAVCIGTQRTGYLYQEGLIFSPDGHCRAFDAKAQGTVGGSGVGVVVLKRLTDALEDGDTIHAIIKGTAINNDGALKVGYTAPSKEGQARVIANALAMADVRADTITYVEGHGTGTPLGDPIEIAALTEVFQAQGAVRQGCAIGSVKPNIGHLDTAAGIAGLIKTVLALKHRQIPPSLYFDAPNIQIDLDSSPFYVNTKLMPWASNTPRRAGVSSFGVGGTNAHVVLEEAPAPVCSDPGRSWNVLVLSAKTRTALDAATENLAVYLRAHPQANLADVAYTLQVGRREFTYRRMLLAHNTADAIQALDTRDPQRLHSHAITTQARPVVFLFPGQGAQYVRMAAELYQTEPVFRQHVDRCAELLEPHLGLDLRDVLYPDERPTTNDERPTTNDHRTGDRPVAPTRGQADKEIDLSAIGYRLPADSLETQHSTLNTQNFSSVLDQTQYAQPALFVIEYALARLWMAWGVQPAAMIGQSIGEYVAACLAGVFSLEDALWLVAVRGRIVQDLPVGAMLSVNLPEQELRPLLDGRLDLAASNGPALSVVSGPIEAIDALERQLAEQGASCRRLHTSHAFHSAMMDAAVPALVDQVRQIELRAPQIPYISNLTGTWITANEATDPEYWGLHLRQTVRFAEGVQTLLQTPDSILLEVGPGRTLGMLARLNLRGADTADVLASLGHPDDPTADIHMLLNAVGRLWLVGAQIDWHAFHRPQRRRRLGLPTYPFERQRYWIDLPPQARHGYGGAAASVHTPEAQPLIPSEARHDRPNVSTTYIAPRTSIEQRIASIWQEFMGIQQIGIYDDFFELGGHSLMAVQLIARLRDAFPVELALDNFFEALNIASQAEVIEALLMQKLEGLSDEEAQALLEPLAL